MAIPQSKPFPEKGEDKQQELTSGNVDSDTVNELDKLVVGEQILPSENDDNEIANNDGSIKETLDTDFHGFPGYVSNHSLAGSNRAEYYEKQSQGKTDTEEEQEYIKNHPQE